MDDSIRDAEPVRTAGQEEFDAALAAFTAQFDAALTGGASDGFCVGFYTVPGSALFDKYRMRAEPCYVRFENGKGDSLEAWVESLTSEDQLVVFQWMERVWTLIGKGVATKVYDARLAEPGDLPEPPSRMDGQVS